jgi:hypothetical protein
VVACAPAVARSVKLPRVGAVGGDSLFGIGLDELTAAWSGR